MLALKTALIITLTLPWIVEAKSLPNHLDYLYHKKVYQKYKANSDRLRDISDMALSVLESSQEEIHSIKAKISNNESSIVNNEDTIEGLQEESPLLQESNKQMQAEIENLNEAIDSRDSQIQVLLSDISRLQNRRQDVVSDRRPEQDNFNRLQNRLREVRNRLGEVRSKLKSLKGEKQNKEKKIKKLQEQKKTLQTQLSKQKKDLETNTKALTQEEGKFSQAKKDVATLEKEISDAKATGGLLKKGQDDALAEKNTAAQELETVKKKPGVTPAEIKAAEDKLSEKTKIYDAAAALVQQNEKSIKDKESKKLQLQKEVEKITKNINNLKKTIANLKKSIPQTEGKIKKTDQSVTQLQKALPTLNQQIKELQPRRKKLRGRVDKLNARVEESRRRLQEFDRHIADLSSEINNKRRFKESLEDQNTLAENKVVRLQNTIYANRRQIQQNTEDIQNLKNRNEDLKQQIAQLKNELPGLYKKRDTAQIDFNQKNKEASTAEQETESKRQKMLAVKKAFDDLVAKASADGQARGGQEGSRIAGIHGKKDGQKSGQQVGFAQGKEDGLLAGFNQGKATGVAEGQKNGYDAGFNLPENYQSGYKRGLQAGDERAMQEALSTDYPRGRNDKRAELTSVLPEKKVSFDNRSSANSKEGSEKKSGQPVFMTLDPQVLLAQTSPQFIGERAWTGMGDRLSVSNSTDSQGICQGLVRTPIEHKDVPSSSSRCQFKYTVINKACHESYQAAYSSRFKSQYPRVYRSQKQTSCVASYDQSFDQHDEVRFQEGYKLMYAVTYDRWEKKGAEDAQNKGYTDGDKVAYDESRPVYRQQQYSRGQEEESVYFAENSYLQIQSVVVKKISSGDKNRIIAGDQLRLQLNIVNFGEQGASPSETQVRIRSYSSSISKESGQEWISLKSIPAQSQAHVLNLADLRVSPTAMDGDAVLELSLKAKGQAEQKHQFKIRVSPHIKLQKVKNKWTWPYQEKPRVGATQFVALTFKNESQLAPREDLVAELSFPGLSSSQVKFHKNPTRISKGQLSPGQKTKLVKFEYELKSNDVAGRRINMVVTVRYKNAISYQETIVLQPQEECFWSEPNEWGECDDSF